MLEKVIQNEIMNFLAECNIFCWKNASVGIFDKKIGQFRAPKSRYQIKGVSDILGIMPDGRFLAIEVKTKVGKPTPEQMKFITAINGMGGVAFISRSTEQTYDQLEKFWPEIQKYRNVLRRFIVYGVCQ